jgi:enediyne core biosynthesis thioesterase
MHDNDVRNSYLTRRSGRPHDYEYRHVVEFEETGVTGAVFDANYVRWQGRCHEMFMLEHAPDVLDELGRGLRFVTLAAGYRCLAAIQVGDELSIRMRVKEQTWNHIALAFDYVPSPWDGEGERLVGKGHQLIACMRDGNWVGVPDQLRLALAGCQPGGPRDARPTRLGTGGRA